MSRVATILSAAAAVAGALAMSSDAVAAAAPAVDVGSSGTSGSAEDALVPCSGLARASRCVGGGRTRRRADWSCARGVDAVRGVRTRWLVWSMGGCRRGIRGRPERQWYQPDVGEHRYPRLPMQRNVDRDWSIGCSVLVDVEVNSGDCSANQWVLTMTGDQIIGVDPLHPGTRVTFTRR